MPRNAILIVFLLMWVGLSACQGPRPSPGSQETGLPGPEEAVPAGRVLAIETFLADIAQHVAGGYLVVESLVPYGIDPHSLELTPQDVVRIVESDVVIYNGSGFESWLEEVLTKASSAEQSPALIEASAGLTSREHEEEPGHEDEHGDNDPHFWLDPNLVMVYAENIRDGLAKAYPEADVEFSSNTEDYIEELRSLDAWIRESVSQVPEENRKLVTNHESFGYFADRYGFQVVGAVIPSVTTNSSPSAQQITSLVQRIREDEVKAVFLETGANPDLADQLARETGIKVVTDLYTHSITPAGGVAPSYIDMMKHNVRTIVEALQ
jgi:ABC-type Zn uptake system ZnuABC Zn-binding protein ZnuA